MLHRYEHSQPTQVIIKSWLCTFPLVSIDMHIVSERFEFIPFTLSPLCVDTKTQFVGEVIRKHCAHIVKNKLVNFCQQNLGF